MAFQVQPSIPIPVRREGGVRGGQDPKCCFFPQLCSFMDNTNPSADALMAFGGRGGGRRSAAGHAMLFSVLERAGGRHSLSTRFYIRHTVAVLGLQSLLQLAFLLVYVYLCFSPRTQSSLLFYHAALTTLIQIFCEG